MAGGDATKASYIEISIPWLTEFHARGEESGVEKGEGAGEESGVE